MNHPFPYLVASVALLLGAASEVQAQSSLQFGPRLGLNLSTLSGSDTPDGYDYDTKSIVGVQVGGTLSVGINDNFSFQPSLLYSQKGAEFSFSQSDDLTTVKVVLKPKLNYLELPLNFVYTVGGESGLQLFVGPYAAIGISGGGSYKATLTSNDPDNAPFNGTYPGSLKVEFADKQNDNSNLSNGNPSSPTLTVTARRFDFGLNAGIGYRVGPFQAQLGYGLGLANFVPKDSDGNETDGKGHHRVIQLSANYFLGGK